MCRPSQESGDFNACAEHINPCSGSCSGGDAEDYADSNWGTCNGVPTLSADSFSIGSTSLPADACGTLAQRSAAATGMHPRMRVRHAA